MNRYKVLLSLILLFCSVGAYAYDDSREKAIACVKEMFYATAKGDVAKLHKLMSSEFYQKCYPYSDAKVKEMLLSVPLKKRQNMIHQIKYETDASTILNEAGDCITVIFTNRVTKKQMTFQLIDEYGMGLWSVDNYWK